MTGRSVRKALIVIILAVFLVITWLTSVMYLSGNTGTNTTGALSWDVVDSWTAVTWTVVTWTVDTSVATWKTETPVLTPAEAQKKLQEYLSGS